MARPIKNNADYFSHDSGMRDDPRIKALRRKFKVEGYGIYCMFLELITDSDNFKLMIDYEIIGGDFDLEPEKVQQIMGYCITLGLFQFDAGNMILTCKTLENRFEGLLSKRKRDRTGVIADDNPHSKVKYSKGYIDHGVGKLQITIRKTYTGDKIHRIFDVKKYFEFTEQIGSLNENGWVHFSEFLKANAGKMFNDADHLYNSFRSFCIDFKPPVNGTKYKNAELDKDLWTLEAWEKQYDYYLKNDNGFRKHFGYEEL